MSFLNGKPDKANYRRFRIKDVKGMDDFKMVAEVVCRRYGRLKREGLTYPDLVVIDGGKGQLAAAVEGNGPWPVWMTMTIDELETEGERQAADERLMQERQRAEADLLLAIAAAEDEALTIRSRERLALAQVERLRTIYAATTGATMFGTAHRDISPTR